MLYLHRSLIAAAIKTTSLEIIVISRLVVWWMIRGSNAILPDFPNRSKR